MLLNELEFIKIAKISKNESIDDHQTIMIENLHINKLVLNKRFYSNIQYLSFKNNMFQDLSFITYFPNLWHLDIRDNPVSLYTLTLTLNPLFN